MDFSFSSELESHSHPYKKKAEQIKNEQLFGFSYQWIEVSEQTTTVKLKEVENPQLCGFFLTLSNCPTSAGCPTIQFNSDTTYLKLVADLLS